MKITVMGTGTSGGVPVLTCDCDVCQSTDPRDNRLRVSVLIQTEGKNIVIDSGPDFRQQVLKTKIKDLDALLFTHEHKDHTAGLDDIRPFNYLRNKDHIPIYARQSVLEQLKREFHYAFDENAYPGVPRLKTVAISNQDFNFEGIKITPIEVMHYKLPVFGFRIKDFTYITDTNYISEAEIEKAKGSKVLIINALQQSPHISHFTLEQAIQVAKQIGANTTYFTHISHKMGLHEEVNQTLPVGMQLAYDGLTFSL